MSVKKGFWINFLILAIFIAMGTAPNCDFDLGEDKMYVFENSKLVEAAQEVPGKFYIKGGLEQGRFVADGQIMGDSEFASEGMPGWFELSSQQFFSQQTSQAPISPYVIGFMTPEGFVPSKREIY